MSEGCPPLATGMIWSTVALRGWGAFRLKSTGFPQMAHTVCVANIRFLFFSNWDRCGPSLSGLCAITFTNAKDRACARSVAVNPMNTKRSHENKKRPVSELHRNKTVLIMTRTDSSPLEVDLMSLAVYQPLTLPLYIVVDSTTLPALPG